MNEGKAASCPDSQSADADADGIMMLHFQRTEHLFGPSLWDEPATNEDDVAHALINLCHSHDLSAQEQALIGGLVDALIGRPRFHRLRFKKPRAGEILSEWKADARFRQATAMTNEIDIAVCRGIKQDAAINSAAKKFDLSEREVFCRLKEVRALRRKMLLNREELLFYGDYFPQGYRPDAEGKLVLDDAAPD